MFLNCSQLRKRLQKCHQGLSNAFFKTNFLAKSSKFCVVWIILFCSNSMRYKHFKTCVSIRLSATAKFDFPIGPIFYVTIPYSDIGNLKPLQILFVRHLDHMLVKLKKKSFHDKKKMFLLLTEHFLSLFFGAPLVIGGPKAPKIHPC